jgi:hypothetical protein
MGIALILVLVLGAIICGCGGGTTTTSPTTTTTKPATTTTTTTTTTTATTTTPPTTTTPAAAPGETTTPAAGPVVYISVSVDGELLVAAQPIAIADDMTLDDVIEAAHAAYYSGGVSGYVAGIDPTWGMYLITKCWGVLNTPYVIYNGSPLGADPAVPTTVNAITVVANDNIIICTGVNTSSMHPVSLTAIRSGDSVLVMAVSWTLNFATFTYTHTLLAGANVIDPTTGELLGVTDENGELTIAIPASGVVAIEGMAAINVLASAE